MNVLSRAAGLHLAAERRRFTGRGIHRHTNLYTSDQCGEKPDSSGRYLQECLITALPGKFQSAVACY